MLITEGYIETTALLAIATSPCNRWIGPGLYRYYVLGGSPEEARRASEKAYQKTVADTKQEVRHYLACRGCFLEEKGEESADLS